MKKNRKRSKREELPSFLKKLPVESESLISPTKLSSINQYLGPIFFGGCNQFHPPPHAISLGYTHEIQHQAESKESIANLFLAAKTEINKKQKEVKSFKLKWKKYRREVPVPKDYHYAGTRKIFVPEIFVHVIDLGETTSEIENEFVQEIPLCRFKNNFLSSFSTAAKEITLSDIREKRIPFLTKKERSAHAHFPKELVRIKVIGPNIPAAITVTRMPTKRKRLFLSKLQIVTASQNCGSAVRANAGVQDSTNFRRTSHEKTEVIFPIRKKINN